MNTMNIPGFSAESSLYKKGRYYRFHMQAVVQSDSTSSVKPAIHTVSCGNQFLNTVCELYATAAGEPSCWWIWWDNNSKADCIKAAMVAGFPPCWDCSVTAR